MRNLHPRAATGVVPGTGEEMTKAEWVVFDTETSGTNVFEDRVVQCVVSLATSAGELLETHEWLIKPDISVPEEAAAVHGFDDAFLAEHGRDPKDALTEISEVLMANRHLVWVAFNINFDLSILDAEFRRYGVSDRFGKYVSRHVRLFDGLVVDRAKDKYRKGSRKLENVAAHYGVPFDPEAAHKADYDVEITAKVAARVAEKFGIPTNAEQKAWYADWAEGLERYLRKTDPEAVVDRDWPLRLKEEA